MEAIDSLVGWVPICRLGDHATLGALDGRVAVDGGQGRRHVGPADLVGLLPLLEQPFAEFLAVLDVREAELNVESGSLRQWIPWPAVIRLASLSPSAYWAELALRWIEAMPVEERDEVALHDLGTTPGLPQALRHRSRRVAAETRRTLMAEAQHRSIPSSGRAAPQQ